jgi:4-amino-4-deoxy-L-arabinose transferase-like glycosyltransferase
MVLALLAGLIFWQRVRLIHMPLQGDICAYAVIGHEMMHGRQLYSDLWERKPPLLYATYAAAECVAGYSPNEMFALGLSFSLGTLVLIYFLGACQGRGSTGGVAAAVLWTLLNVDLAVTGNQPDPEALMNFWMCAALLLLVRWPAGRWWAPVGVGLLSAAMTLYKHNAALAVAGLLVGHFIAPGGSWRRRFAECLITGGTVLVVWAGVLAYFAACHRADAFIDVLFRENVAYSRSISDNFTRAISARHLWPPWMYWIVSPLAMVLVLGLFAVRDRKFAPGREWVLLAGLAVGVFATIAVTGYLNSHYYQLWLPIGCVGGGWAVAGLIGGGSSAAEQIRIPGVIGWTTVVLGFSFLLIRQGREFFLTPEQWINAQFPGYHVPELNQLGAEIGQLLHPDECFWEFGDDNALYFCSRHSPPTGLLFIDPYLYGPRVPTYWKRLMHDLESRRPALVVLSDDYVGLFPPDAPVFPWLKENYLLWETPGLANQHLLVRRGSDLAKRLGIDRPK